MRRLTKVALVAISLSMLVNVNANAHGGATGVVKERMTIMETLGKSLKELTAMMRGKTPCEPERVRQIARQISSHGGDSMTKLFPKDSLDKPSEARPNIWTQWGKFEGLASQLTSYAKALEKSANNKRGASTSGGIPQVQGMMNNSGMMTNMPEADPELLANMPPDAAYIHITQTCGSCHEGFRKPKK